jgi:hypothetical protein
MLIFDDVGRVEEQGLRKPGYRASSIVGCDDSLAKERLVKPLFHCSQGVAPFWERLGHFRRRHRGIFLEAEHNASLERCRIPSDDIRREEWFVAARSDPEEIDYRNPVFHRFTKPTIVGRFGITTHEGIVDSVVPLEDLAMDLSLVIVPDPTATSREHCCDREQIFCLARFENATLRVDERNALVLEHEPRTQLRCREMVAIQTETPNMVPRGQPQRCVTIGVRRPAAHGERCAVRVWRDRVVVASDGDECRPGRPSTEPAPFGPLPSSPLTSCSCRVPVIGRYRRYCSAIARSLWSRRGRCGSAAAGADKRTTTRDPTPRTCAGRRRRATGQRW